MRLNRLKEHLLAGKPAYAPTCTLGCPETVEIACNSGFDWVFLDAQHGSFTKDSLRESIRATQTTQVTPLVRPSATNSAGEIEWILDQGAQGIVCAMVNTAEQAREIVQAAYYIPKGNRSAGGGRCVTHFGEEYLQQANDHILVFVMIEQVEGVNNVEEIAAVDGISGVKVGAGDLALSLGGTSDQIARGEVLGMEEALARILDGTKRAGKIPGIYCANSSYARNRAKQGFQLITIDYEFNIMRRAMQKIVEDVHAD